MIFHMKTTLIISDPVMRRIKQEAAREGRTISELVEAALRLFLEGRTKPPVKLRPLPTFNSGGWYIDPADREAIYSLPEED